MQLQMTASRVQPRLFDLTGCDLCELLHVWGILMDSGGMSDEGIKRLLQGIRTIAVVGLSADPDKDSHKVASYLKRAGYEIVPVNPSTGYILDEKSYPDLRSVDRRIDLVDVFRPSREIPEIVAQTEAIGAKVIWIQLGIRNDEAARKARAAGMTVIQDACLYEEHSRLAGRAP